MIIGDAFFWRVFVVEDSSDNININAAPRLCLEIERPSFKSHTCLKEPNPLSQVHARERNYQSAAHSKGTTLANMPLGYLPRERNQKFPNPLPPALLLKKSVLARVGTFSRSGEVRKALYQPIFLKTKPAMRLIAFVPHSTSSTPRKYNSSNNENSSLNSSGLL